MTSQNQKLKGMFFIYLIMSIDPISAARIHASHLFAKETVSESQTLLQELKKAMEDTQDMSHENATGFHSYIGESWASCAQRKADYERRAMKLQKMYDKSTQDESYSSLDAGWIVLKARKLAMTLSAAEKRGCEWVVGGQVDTLSTTNHMLDQTKQFVPCHGAAKKFAESKKHDPDQEKVAADIMHILLSTDCKPTDTEKPADLDLKDAEAIEEEEEFEVQRSAEELEKLAKDKTDGSLLESYHKVADKSNWVLVINVGPIWAALSASLYFIFLFLTFTANCMIQVALPIFLLMYIFCLLMTFIKSLYTDLSSETRRDEAKVAEDAVVDDAVQRVGAKVDDDSFFNFNHTKKNISTGFKIVALCSRKMLKVVQVGAPVILFGCAAAQALAPIMPGVQKTAVLAAKAVGRGIGATAVATGNAAVATAHAVGHVAYAVGTAFVYVGSALISVFPTVRIVW